MIHEITPHKYNVAYKHANAAPEDIMLIYGNGGVLCMAAEGQTEYPTVGEVEKIYPEVMNKIRYLFEVDGRNYFDLPGVELKPFGQWQYLPKERIRQMRPMWKAFAGITGFQLQDWYAGNQFCGRCGEKMQHHKRERAMVCPACGKLSYPQISPSVIVAITDKDRILLTKYASNHSSYKRYALVAGYNEIGESLEDTVRREVMEEVGLKVKNIRYYKSQPWSFSGALLMGFFCEADGNTEVSLDREELSAAEWFLRSEMPKDRSEADISLTGEMMQVFEDGKWC